MTAGASDSHPVPPRPEKTAKSMKFLAPPYPKSLQICNFYENLKILSKSRVFFIKIGAKNDEFQLEIGKNCEVRRKKA